MHVTLKSICFLEETIMSKIMIRGVGGPKRDLAESAPHFFHRLFVGEKYRSTYQVGIDGIIECDETCWFSD